MKKQFFMLLTVSAPLYAMDQAEQTVALTGEFEAKKEFFDDVVNQWYRNIFGNVVKVASNHKSDYAQALVDLSASDLHGLCEDEKISKQAEEYWKTKISINPDLLEAYNCAVTACKSKKSEEVRKEKWQAFREKNRDVIKNIMREDLGLVFPISKPQVTLIQRILEENALLALDDNAKTKLAALTVLQHTGRQIQRNQDKETDSANMLLDKTITDQEN